MPNQESPVSNNRRRLLIASLSAPVVLTLPGRTAFGAQCLSQVMSGNMSQVGTGSCELGRSPSTWANAGVGSGVASISLSAALSSGPVISTVIDKDVFATVYGVDNTRVHITEITTTTKHVYQWSGMDFIYGELYIVKTVTTLKTDIDTLPSITVTNANPPMDTSPNINNGSVTTGVALNTGTRWAYANGGSQTEVFSPSIDAVNSLPAAKPSDFVGGTAFNHFSAFGAGSAVAMREILNANSASNEAICVAALLNASYTPSINYALDAQQVRDLANGLGMVPPGYTSVFGFLSSTW